MTQCIEHECIAPAHIRNFRAVARFELVVESDLFRESIHFFLNDSFISFNHFSSVKKVS